MAWGWGRSGARVPPARAGLVAAGVAGAAAAGSGPAPGAAPPAGVMTLVVEAASGLAERGAGTPERQITYTLELGGAAGGARSGRAARRRGRTLAWDEAHEFPLACGAAGAATVQIWERDAAPGAGAALLGEARIDLARWAASDRAQGATGAAARCLLVAACRNRGAPSPPPPLPSRSFFSPLRGWRMRRRRSHAAPCSPARRPRGAAHPFPPEPAC
jgi:hypothetical protein